MSSKNLILAVLAVALLGIVGYAFLGGGGPQVPTVPWSEEDELTIADEQEPVEGVEADLANPGRRSVETEQAVAGARSGEEARPELKLNGRVVDKFGRGVTAATVHLEIRRAGGRGGFGGGQGGPGGNRQQIRPVATTDGEGRFAFEGRGFTNLGVTLTVSHRDYAVTFSDHEFEQAGKEVALGDVVVRNGGSVLGSVTDLDGLAITNAEIRIQPVGGNRLAWARDRDQLIPAVKVDGNGTFRIPHLAAGEYRFEASAPRRLRANSETVQIAEDIEETIEQFRLGPGQVITGTVFASDGNRVANAQVRLNGGGPRMRDQDTRTDKQGNFTFDHLPTATVALRVEAEGYVTFVQGGIETASGTPLIVRLQDGLRIAGIARDAVTGNVVERFGARVRRIGNVSDPAREAAVAKMRAEMETVMGMMRAGEVSETDRAALRTRLEGLRNEFGALGVGGGRGGRGDREAVREIGETMMRGGRNNQPGDVGDVVARPEGRFTFAGLDEGVYVVDIGSPDHQRIRSQQVELRAGSPPAELVVNLPRGFTVTGAITDREGAPIAGADLELLLQSDDEGNAGGRRGGRGGRGGDNNGPAAAAPGGDARRTMFEQFRGQTGPRGTPILSAKSDAKGNYTFRHAPAGRYVVSARAKGFANGGSDAFALAADAEGVAVNLGALAVIEGSVTGIPNGKLDQTHVLVFAGMGGRSQRTIDLRPDATFVVEDLQPGSYIVRAVVGDMQTYIGREMGRIMRENVGAMFGGQGGPGRNSGGNPVNAATPPRGIEFDVELKEGERKQLRLTAITQPAGTVVGSVTKNGEPGRGLRVMLQAEGNEIGGMLRNFGNLEVSFGPGGGGPGGGRGGRGMQMMGGIAGFHSAVVDGRGEFRIEDVPSGSYTLRVQSNGRGNQELYRTSIVVSDGVESRTQVSVSTGSIAGTIKAEEGTATSSLTGNVQLIAGTRTPPEDLEAALRQNQNRNIPIRSGRFDISDLPGGDYLLVVTLRGRERSTVGLFVGGGETSRVEVEAGKPRQPQPGNGSQTPPPR